MATNARDENHEESTCPTCDREFTSARGMRVHHIRVHGERLPNRHCADCDTAFYAPYAERVRCDDCVTVTAMPEDADAARSTERGDTTGTCLVCDAGFRHYASEKAGRYCPACVADSDVSCTVHVQSSERVTVSCSHCGEVLEAFRSEADAQRPSSATVRATARGCRPPSARRGSGVATTTRTGAAASTPTRSMGRGAPARDGEH